MTVIQAVFLGLLQGLTEFLPISSSGHLVIAQHFLNVNDGGLFFEVLLHCATLVAVIAAYWQDLRELLKKPFQKYTYLLIAGTIPTGIIGLASRDDFEVLFSSVRTVGYMLLVTGVILLIAEYVSRNIFPSSRFRYWQAIVIGLAQGLAITPGISRSGTTIAAGMLLGLKREEAARFSFLMSIPAILGAAILEGKDIVFTQHIDPSLFLPYLLGAITAGIFGYLSIKLLLGILNRGKLYYFSFYCWIVGILTLVFA